MKAYYMMASSFLLQMVNLYIYYQKRYKLARRNALPLKLI